MSDTERMNWLEKNASSVYNCEIDGEVWWEVYSLDETQKYSQKYSRGKTLREAIDGMREC